MGNCAPKPRRRSPSPPPSVTNSPSYAAIELHAEETCPIAARIRVALLYKGATAKVVISSCGGDSTPEIRIGSESMSGSADLILRFVDLKIPKPPVVAPAAGKENRWLAAAAVEDVTDLVALQHRSIERNLEGVVRWSVEASAAKGEGTARKAARRYGELVEIMLEHAQMEERLLFPIIERASDDSGVSTVANEEHARALPMMNGINEELKSVMTMKTSDPCFREALLILSSRLTKLQVHCKEHFRAEEKMLLPLLKGGGGGGGGGVSPEVETDERRRSLVEKVVYSMENTHSHHFPLFMAGLLPPQAMQYVDLLCRCIADQKRLVRMLHSLASWLEGLPSPPSATSSLLVPL